MQIHKSCFYSDFGSVAQAQAQAQYQWPVREEQGAGSGNARGSLIEGAGYGRDM